MQAVNRHLHFIEVRKAPPVRAGQGCRRGVASPRVVDGRQKLVSNAPMSVSRLKADFVLVHRHVAEVPEPDSWVSQALIPASPPGHEPLKHGPMTVLRLEVPISGRRHGNRWLYRKPDSSILVMQSTHHELRDASGDALRSRIRRRSTGESPRTRSWWDHTSAPSHILGRHNGGQVR
jgi:hypothetical protein